MTVESGVFSILATSADLAAAAGVPTEQLSGIVMRAGAVVDPAIPQWMAVRWEPDRLDQNLGTRSFTLRAHDRDRTYSWIDSVLEAAKDTLTAVVHQQGITQIDWQGRSPDLADDGYDTLTRYDTYVVAAGLATRKEG